MKQKNRWPDAHIALKRLYDARVPEGMTQKEFGAKYDIGTQPMVWQYLTGYRPISYDVAAKFARGLRCTIYDISPEMGESLQLEILPFLGKALRRAAVLAFFMLPALTPSPADARQLASDPSPSCVLCEVLRRLIAAVRRLWARSSVRDIFPFVGETLQGDRHIETRLGTL